MNKEMFFSVLMALCVVLGSVALLNRSLIPMKSKEAQIEPQPNTDEDQPHQANERDHIHEAPVAIDSTETISKCIIGGKVIYSDKPCPKNGTVSQVEIHESSGIVTPAREVVNKTMRRIEEERRRENQSMQSNIAIIEKPNKQTCNEYQARINYYDAIARQPQSGYTQDWIRSEIVEIRRLQTNARC